MPALNPTNSPTSGPAGTAAAPHRGLPTRRRDALADLAALALVTALTMAYFFPLLTGHTNSITGPYGNFVYPWAGQPNEYTVLGPQTDYAELSYPWNVLTDGALAAGTVPLWTPGAYGGGYDLFANGSSAVLYPPRLLALAVTSPVRAHDLFLVFHVWASGIAMYLLARQLSRGRWAATFAAVAWMFATWNTGWMQLEVVTPMALFLPATVAAVHRAVTARRWLPAIGAGVVCALAATAGHILLLGLVLFVAALYTVALTVSVARRRADRGAVLGRVAVLGAVAGGLGAVVLLPTVIAIGQGQRVPFTYDELQAQFLAEPWMLARLVLPPQLPITADRMQYLGFAGTATALLAVPGLLSRGRNGAWLARCLVVLVPLVMIGTPLTWLAWRLVPGMDVFRPYSRLVVFAAFGLVLAAAIGVDVIRDALGRLLPAEGPGGLGRQAAASAVMAVVLVATAGQLMQLGRRMNPLFIPYEARYLLPSTPLVEELRAGATPQGWPSRTAPVLLRSEADEQLLGLIFYGNTPQVVGLDTLSGYDSTIDRRSLALQQVLGGADPADPGLGSGSGAYYGIFEAWTTRFDLLARVGVTHVATMPALPGVEPIWSDSWDGLGAEVAYRGPDGIAYRLPGATAGPRLVAADEVVDGDRDALVRFTDPDFPADRVVLVEQDELDRTATRPLGPDDATTATATGEVLRASRGVNTATIEVQADRPAWLVVPDAWAEGWQATIDGEPAPVVRVNYVQRAVRVDPGTSVVRFRYRPGGFVAGAATSAVTATAALAATAALVVRRRRSAVDGFELEDELVAEQSGHHEHAGAIDGGDGTAQETGPGRLG